MRKYIITAVCFLLIQPAFAQFENRANFYVGAGIPFFEKESGLRSKEIFNGYQPVPSLSIAGLFAVNKRLQIGLDLNQVYTVKENYKMNITSVGGVLKYNFIPFNKRISPYVYGAFHVSYLFVSQKQSSETKTGSVVEGSEFVEVREYYVEYPEINLGVFPVMGAHGGVGLEINPRSRRKNVGGFISLNYFHSVADSRERFRDFYSENTSTLKYVYASAGIRLSFLRRKSMY